MSGSLITSQPPNGYEMNSIKGGPFGRWLVIISHQWSSQDSVACSFLTPPMVVVSVNSLFQVTMMLCIWFTPLLSRSPPRTVNPCDFITLTTATDTSWEQWNASCPLALYQLSQRTHITQLRMKPSLNKCNIHNYRLNANMKSVGSV